jgi:hypothetical protein
MIRASADPAQPHLAEDEPLEAERPTPDPERPAANPGAAAPDTDPPGLRAQLGATRDAVLGMLRAHVDLAKAELDEIKGEVARAAALGGLAFAVLLLLAFLLPIGGLLFLGEWIFGSIGWGLLHGTELLVAVAVLAVLVAIRVRGLFTDLALALVIGVVVALVLGPNLPNELWRRIGDSMALGDAAWRPLATGTLVVTIIGGLVGLVLGARAGGAGAAIGGLIGGAILGALLGAFSAITFGWRVGVALGVAAALAAWPILMGVTVARSGVDTEALKARFWPQTTIDTTKETIEWAKARSPLGPKS